MAKITNTSSGPRGFHAISGEVMLSPGQSWEGDISDGELTSAMSSGWFGDGEDDGLAALTVAQLKDVATAEEIDLGDASKKADIISAIELAREDKAKA